MPQPLYTFAQKTNTQIRDDGLRVLKNGLIQLGISSNPNVGPGSDYYLIFTAVGNELAVVQANCVLTADRAMPDTAAGADLDRWLKIFGLSRNAAIGSHGNISAPCNQATTTIATGAQLQDNAGLRYQVAAGGTYTATNGALTVPVLAIDTGKATNHANGDTLKWVSPPPYCATNTTVGAVGGSDGLTGGTDSEVGVDEPPRARLFALLQSPPKGGNSAEVATWCTQSSPVVQGAFVYPALLGPSTIFAAVTQQPQAVGTLSSTSKNRDITPALMTGTVQPYVQGLIPEHVFSVVVSAANQPVDVSVLLSLPSAPTASPPGPGGGWLDGSPWPTSTSSGTAPTTVTVATSATSFTVSAPTPPTPGVSHIAWLSPLTWTLYTATVLTVTGTPGAYAITIDSPMPGISVGHHVFPQSQNQSAYVAAMFAAFSTMGPGEWTTSANVKARAFRHPVPTLAWPYALGAVQLKQIINAGTEVLDANWIYRSVTTPTVPATVTVDPTTGVLTSAPPNVLVPRNISFYAA